MSDDGKGFEITQEVEGQVLASMRRRAQSFGGKIEIISPDGNGTTIKLLIPVGQYRRKMASTKDPPPANWFYVNRLAILNPAIRRG